MTEEERSDIAERIVRGNAGVLLTLVIQTVTVVWAIAGLFERVDNLTKQFVEMRADMKEIQMKAYTTGDALRDLGRLEANQLKLIERVEKLEERTRR